MVVGTLKVLELFAGIGACSKALTNLGIDHEIVDAVEIDKFAIKSFNAVHGTNFEPQDITEWDKDLDDVDLIMHGSPCQDFSVAGKGAGGDEGSGTRSSLMYETLRIVENLRPYYVIWENVPNVLSEKHHHNFSNYLMRMRELGYLSLYSKLNAKDFGIPQNRLRVFTVSVYLPEYAEKFGDDLQSLGMFKFPEPIPLKKSLKDMLESEVDERYYLTEKNWLHYNRNFGSKGKLENPDESVSTLQAAMGSGGGNTPIIKVGDLDIKGHDAIKRVYSPDGLSPTLTTMGGGNREPKIIASRGRGEHNEQHLEPRKDGLTNTLTSVQKDNMVCESNFHIRKLTPKECWRLMGFSDEDFDRASKVNSNSQLYKQAGNSIVVNVLEGILRNLLEKE